MSQQKTKTKTQKIIKVGNSYAITLDKKFIDANGFKVSDAINVTYQADPKQIGLSPEVIKQRQQRKLSLQEKKEVLETKIPKSFRDWVDKSLEEDKVSLKLLAKS